MRSIEQSKSFATIILFLYGSTFLACDFRPLYSTKIIGYNLYNQIFTQIDIKTTDNRLSQILRNAIFDRINPSGIVSKPKYRLDVTIKEDKAEIMLLRESTLTLAQYIVEVKWELIEIITNKALVNGQNERTSNFFINSSEYANLRAERAASFRAITELADDIRLHIALYFDRTGGERLDNQ
ncbi:hypothetical protein A1OE_476 [Candidatus Endolissoclinum faulkneri L2]|uniref:Lipopolysaccharide-assembly family protein n=1 Tax=Candidatus Endolissoclinum faulkneri L2 TaxID=1193729 RepID=K7YQ11_9PROT|nr:hypothetical protein A1OE_476 [Candidatus Endolissoclinum faulkneri L2]